jgi:thiol-disulfide isomerase/thioredoxin
MTQSATPPAPDRDDPPPAARRWAGIAVVVAVFAISSVSIFGGELLQSSEAERNRAPALEATDPTGRRVSLNDDGLPTALLFVAETCTACERQLEVFERSADRWAEKIDFVVIDQGEAGPSTDLYRRAGYAGGATATGYGITERPALVLVTANEQILLRRTTPFSSEDLERQLRSVIAEGPKRDGAP